MQPVMPRHMSVLRSRVFALLLSTFVVSLVPARGESIESVKDVDLDKVGRVLDELITAVDATDATRLQDRGESFHRICLMYLNVHNTQL